MVQVERERDTHANKQLPRLAKLPVASKISLSRSLSRAQTPQSQAAGWMDPCLGGVRKLKSPFRHTGSFDRPYGLTNTHLGSWWGHLWRESSSGRRREKSKNRPISVPIHLFFFQLPAQLYFQSLHSPKQYLHLRTIVIDRGTNTSVKFCIRRWPRLWPYSFLSCKPLYLSSLVTPRLSALLFFAYPAKLIAKKQQNRVTRPYPVHRTSHKNAGTFVPIHALLLRLSDCHRNGSFVLLLESNPEVA